MENHSSEARMDTKTREKDGRDEKAGAGAVEELVAAGNKQEIGGLE